MNIDYLKNFLKLSGLKPKHYLGQNFLIDEVVLDEIIDIAGLKETDTVLEVGPGLGVLTARLAASAGKVIAVEKDEALLDLLKKNLGDAKNVEIINDDILKFHLANHTKGNYKVVANIPYYLSSHLFQYFLKQENQPQLMVLMVQKEVGERITAKEGDLSVLGISVQMKAGVEIALHVLKDSFWPVPKVDSVVLKIEPKNKFPEVKDEKLFFRIVKSAFAGKRKQIHNTLGSGLKLPKEKVLSILQAAGIDPLSRPQDISIEGWAAIYKRIELL